MKNILLFTLLLLVTLSGMGQDTPPIMKEVPKRGVYYNAIDFLQNKPDNKDSIFFKSRYRTKELWKNTLRFIPYKFKTGRRVKNIWGYSDGKTAFIYRDKEFFPIVIGEEKIRFESYGDDRKGTLGGVIGGALGGVAGYIIAVKTRKPKVSSSYLQNPRRIAKNGVFRSFSFGAVVGGIVSDASDTRYKKIRIVRYINPFLGNVEWYYSNSLDEEPSADVMVYRIRDEDEKEISVIVGDSLVKLGNNSFNTISVPLSTKEIVVCLKETNQCLGINVVSQKPQYINVRTTSEGLPFITVQKPPKSLRIE